MDQVASDCADDATRGVAGARPPRWPIAMAAASLVLACAAAYSNSLDGRFVGDDMPSIVRNRSIRSLTPILPVLLTARATTTEGRPVLNLSLALNYATSKYDVRDYHLTNIAIHMAASLLLFGIARRSLLSPVAAEAYRRRATSLAWAIALVWCLHPIQTESVTYVIQRAESLASLLSLATLYAVIRGALAQAAHRTTAAGWFVLGVGACLLAMGTKEIAVAAPLLVLLYDRVFLCATWREVARKRLWLHVALFSTWILLGYLVVAYGGRSGTAGLSSRIGPMQYFLTQWVAIVQYLRISLWPSEVPFHSGGSIVDPNLFVSVCGLLLTTLALVTILAYRISPPWGWLGTVFFATLAPSSSVVPIMTQSMALHRMYLPLAAVVAAVVLGGDALWQRLAASLPARVRTIVAGIVVLVVAGALGYRTWLRNEDYREPGRMAGERVAQHAFERADRIGAAIERRGASDERGEI